MSNIHDAVLVHVDLSMLDHILPVAPRKSEDIRNLRDRITGEIPVAARRGRGGHEPKAREGAAVRVLKVAEIFWEGLEVFGAAGTGELGKVEALIWGLRLIRCGDVRLFFFGNR